MNDQLLALWNRLRRKVDQVVIFALVVLLGLVILLYYVEQQAPPPVIPALQAPIIDPTPEDWTTFTQVLFVHPKSLRDVGRYMQVVDFNMFDARSARDQSELIARLDEQYEQEALPAYQRGDLDTADRVCIEIIRQLRSHRNAVELRQRIGERRKALEKEGTTP